MCHLTLSQIAAKYQSYYLLHLFSISNLFRIELIFKWAIMIRFGVFLRISFNASFFRASLSRCESFHFPNNPA